MEEGSLHTVFVNLAKASSLCVMLPTPQCPDLDRPHLLLLPSSLYSHRPSSQPWDDCQVCSAYLGFQDMHLMLFEDSRDPCRLLVTTARSPSPVASFYVSIPPPPSVPRLPTGDVTLLLLLLLPALFPQSRADCQKAGSHSCAREPGPQKERLGVEPSPATCRRGAGLQR